MRMVGGSEACSMAGFGVDVEIFIPAASEFVNNGA